MGDKIMLDGWSTQNNMLVGGSEEPSVVANIEVKLAKGNYQFATVSWIN